MLTPEQFDALVSFTFNVAFRPVGLKHVRAGEWAAAIAEASKFITSNGEVIPGLVKRRREELQFFTGPTPGALICAQ